MSQLTREVARLYILYMRLWRWAVRCAAQRDERTAWLRGLRAAPHTLPDLGPYWPGQHYTRRVQNIICRAADPRRLSLRLIRSSFFVSSFLRFFASSLIAHAQKPKGPPPPFGVSNPRPCVASSRVLPIRLSSWSLLVALAFDALSRSPLDLVRLALVGLVLPPFGRHARAARPVA